MEIRIFETKQEMGKAAAEKAAEILKKTIEEKGKATFVAATGASQFEFLENLTKISSIDWSKTVMFHLDEYIGLPEDHPASFRKYLKERLIDKVHPGIVYLINGDTRDPEKECERLNKIINEKEIDVAFVGIGENGHLAFNDPPADFETEKPYI
ncbi:6-phosphogluconolactonase, partial [Candidatus Aerophobetes bacterium]|nr:6-phosphogluconolactonase [Candidatus Aerophobetes bacterium]